MKSKILINFIFAFVLFIFLFSWAYLVVSTHEKDSIVSWDEGFHGGTALFISESLKNNFYFSDFTYILNDFKNGMIWYLPLWSIVAGIFGAIFTPSVDVFRFTTLFFSLLSVILVAYFAKSIAGNKAGLLSAIILATVPVFMVYSHLMMIEIPLLFSTSLALFFFFRYLTKQKLSKYDELITILTFIIGVSTKVTAIAIILGTILVFGVILKLLYKKEKITQRFYSITTVYSIAAAILMLLIFRGLTRKFLNADLIEFYLSQSKQLTGVHGNFLLTLLQNLYSNLGFYFRDLTHMPAIAVFWIGSGLSYLILKRSILSIFLWTWIIVSYFIFSSVKPQAQQYILPIFTPIALASGLFWAEFFKLRNSSTRNWMFPVILILIPWLGIVYLESTETIVWRNTKTYQQSAAIFVAKNAYYGDRVITTGDGSRFLVRLAGVDKKLQTVNGAAPNCPQFVQDSIEWGILDNGPQSPVILEELQDKNWLKVAIFKGSQQNTFVVKNSNKTRNIEILNKGDIFYKCPRLFPLGENSVEVWGINRSLDNVSGKDIEISLKLNPIKVLKKVTIKNKELVLSNNRPFKYNFIFNQLWPNKPVYFWFDIPKSMKFDIQKIVIRKLNS